MKVFKGRVVSAKMTKTATVVVERIVVHPVYKKRYKRAKKYHVHNELGAKVGDTVEFVTSRPYSKLKKWKVIKVVSDKKLRTGRKRKSQSSSLGTNKQKKETKKS